MPKKIDTQPPAWMVQDPKPELIAQPFHNKVINVWKGDIELDEITGWLGNPRTELLREQFFDAYAREPTNEEMCQLALEDDDEKEGLKIKDLAANISKNGVRVPIVLTHEKKLLDGNRRYYACMFLAGMASSKRGGNTFSQIPAFVLPKGTTADDEDAIITEFNFAANMQLQWPYYIRARAVYNDHDEKGLTKEQLQTKYGIPWRYLDKWIKAARLCDRFLQFHDETHNAKQFAYRNFIMFDEMMRNYGARFHASDFREAVFAALLEGYEPENHKQHKFTKSSDVVHLDEVYDNADAWQALVSARGPQALRDAFAILEQSVLGNATDPDPALKRVVSGLDKLVKNRALGSANQELLQAFQEKAKLVPGGLADPASQIEQMVEWLEGMTAKELAELAQGSVSRLEHALKLVLHLTTSAAKRRSGEQSER